MKTTLITIISLLSLSAFAGEKSNSILAEGKQVLIDNLDNLSNLDNISIYTIGSYVVSFNDKTPEGFGAGIGMDYELGSNVEIQLRGLWNDDVNSGDIYTADLALAYRYDLGKASSYIRGLVGYRESVDIDALSSEVFTGAAIGFDISISESTSIKIEPGIIYSADSELMFSIVAGVKLTF